MGVKPTLINKQAKEKKSTSVLPWACGWTLLLFTSAKSSPLKLNNQLVANVS